MGYVDVAADVGIVSFWWVPLGFCTFGVGLALWGAGGLFVFGSWHHAGSMGTMYLLGAVSQIVAGMSMLCANIAFKEYVARTRPVSEIAMAEVLGASSTVQVQCACGSRTPAPWNFAHVSCTGCSRKLANDSAPRVLCQKPPGCGAMNLVPPGSALIHCGGCR